MKKCFVFIAAAVAVFGLFGCVSDKDVLLPSDLTVGELEKQMNSATDPRGVFAASNSYIMRQEIREKQFLDDDVIKMVEVKFEKPDKLALTTYEDNQIASVFCTDGKRGWIADYNSKKVVMLSERGLRRMNMLAALSRPGSGGYQAVFDKVEINKCTNKDGEFYRLTCYGKEQPYPMYLYVDSRNFLLRQAKMKVSVNDKDAFDYESRILNYGKREGVLIPMHTEVRQLGAVQRSKVIHYELNRKFDSSDFQAPVFL